MEDKPVVIFASVPAGFGHLRVTDALIDGMPKGYEEPYLLGSHDEFITALHRFTSIYTVPRKLFETLQYGFPEYIGTAIYVWYTRLRARSIYQQLEQIVLTHRAKPKKLLIVAMHPTLAHQIGEIKSEFENNLGVMITLVVQITDDSPMRIWYTKEADLIFAPSNETKKVLLSTVSDKDRNDVEKKIFVNAYPVSPKLTDSSRKDYCNERLKQLDPQGSDRIHVLVPISGAAVGLDDIATMICAMHESSERFYFHIVAKLNKYTKSFIDKMLVLPYVRMHAELTNRSVVNKYEEIYERYIIALEITKPSEQAFKALLMPDQIGGSLLLFTQPVGRQEYDNILFLESHNLIPTPSETSMLWRAEDGSTQLQNTSLRGLRLPNNPGRAAQFILKCFQSGLLRSMVTCSLPESESEKLRELSSHGVEHFWKVVEEHI